MNSKINNPQVANWKNDPAQQNEFLDGVNERIDRESRYMAGIYGVGTHREDIASGVRLNLLQQMGKIDTDGPFAKDSPQKAADFLLEKYTIREQARSLARKEARKQKRQAEILAQVGPPDLPQDIEAQLLTIARSLPRITSATPNLTPRESKIFRKEVLRRVGVDDLAAPIFDQAARAAGISGSEQREYDEDHDQNGHNSASDRKAWSRAVAKVAKACTRAKLLSLLVIVLASSLALFSAIHLGRSMQQDDFVNQSRFSHQKDLASHQPDARAHQSDPEEDV